MSARVCSPMDLSRNSDINLLSSSCTSSSLAATKELVGTAKRNARRNLFGPPDPRSVQFAREKVEEIKAGSKKYWNFDFDRELPLEGRYKWERVGAGERVGEVPTAYGCQRLPFLGSSSSSSTATTIAKQFNNKTSTSSSTPSSSSSTITAIADRLYYIPVTTSNSQNERREPLLSVSAGVITRSQSSTSSSLSPSSPAAAAVSRIAPQAGTSVAISSESTHQSSYVEKVVEEEEARTKKVIAPTGRSGRHCSENPSIPLSTPSKDGSLPPSGNQVSSSSSLSFITPSVDAMKTDDVKCKVQVKSTKQTKVSDYYNVRKRRAQPEGASSIVEKKAAL